METESTELDEVVVVAYGQQKKVTVTGSVAAVGSAEIRSQSEPNLAAALSGKLPGLTTMQQSGAPGEDDVENVSPRRRHYQRHIAAYPCRRYSPHFHE